MATSTCAGNARGSGPSASSSPASGQRIPTYIPAANEFAQKFAKHCGGTAMSMLPEILFNIPATAHCLGGCVIGSSPKDGVIDHRHRVFRYTNMYVCDGSVVAANLGVNPSLDDHRPRRARHGIHSPPHRNALERPAAVS